MNVFVSIDMEGVAGVAHGEHVRRGSDDYPTCRKLMAAEANAAVDGAVAAGATRIVVNDAHGDMRNLAAEDIDERAELLVGSPKVPHGMMQGIGPAFDVALFVGYHARAGTEAAILDHSYAGAVILDLRVNGEQWGEAELNAALAGSFGVPVGMVSGDNQVCAQVSERLPGTRTVVVKQALGRSNALSAHPSRARQSIRDGAQAATEAAAAGSLQPFTPPGPFHLEVDVVTTGMADVASIVPGATRRGPRTIAFEAPDVATLVRARSTITTMAASVL